MVHSNHILKASFIHIPKCGGVYIRELICKYYGFVILTDRHPNYLDFFNTKDEMHIPEIYDKHSIRKFGKYRYFYTNPNIDRKILDQYYTFTFVRNPYDKIYSAYYYLKRCLNESVNGNTIRNTVETPEYFNDFNTFIQNKDNVNNISYFHAFITQCDQLFDTSNNIKINFIGRTETLNIDFMHVLTSLDIPIHIEHMRILNDDIRYNTSKYNNNITNEINEDTLLFINNYFKKDFETFGYKICDTIDDLKTYYEIKNNSLVHTNVSRLTNLLNTYICANNIHYNILATDQFNIKMKNVTDILIENTLCNLINAITRNEICNLKKELVRTETTNNEMKEKGNTDINNMKMLLAGLIKDEQLQLINVCNICKYKTYNILSTSVHKMLCYNINTKECCR